MTASRPLRQLFAVPAVTVVLALGLAACGSDGSDATDQACTAKDNLSASIKKVGDDVKAGNLGDAKKQLSDVQSKATDLKDAIGNLKSSERDKLQPQIQAVQDDLQSLGDVRSLSDLSTAFSALNTSVTQLFDDLGSDLKCS